MILMDERILYKKSEGRYITTEKENNEEILDIFERTANGVLISKISDKGVILQKYIKNVSIQDALSKLNTSTTFVIKNTDIKEKTKLKKKCIDCCGSLYRELEALEAWQINDIPVIPIFRCEKCSKRYYSLTNEYLEVLVNEQKNLFEAKDLTELEKNKEEFIKTLYENIIRIFASKKISRV